jgi:hypothetical protein
MIEKMSNREVPEVFRTVDPLGLWAFSPARPMRATRRLLPRRPGLP